MRHQMLNRSCDCHVTLYAVCNKLCDCHVTPNAVCNRSCDCHVTLYAVCNRSCDCHVTLYAVCNRSCDCHVTLYAVCNRSCDCHVTLYPWNQWTTIITVQLLLRQSWSHKLRLHLTKSASKAFYKSIPPPGTTPTHIHLRTISHCTHFMLAVAAWEQD